MAYARIPDELCGDDRYLDAVDRCPAAGTLVLFGYAYAAREASDGHVPDRQLRRWLADPDLTRQAVDALVAAGLWARVDDGVQMLDYTHAGRNITRAEWEAKREAERRRKAEWRARVAEERRTDDVPDASVPQVGTDVSQRDTHGTDAGRDASVPGDVLVRERAQTQTLIQTQTQTAATAAAPRAGAREASPASPPSGGGITPPPPVDAAWTAARTALITAGWTAEQVDADRTEVVRDLRRLAKQPNRGIDWPKLGDWLAEQRRAGRCTADRPVASLRFALNGSGPPSRRPRARQASPDAPRPGERTAAALPETTAQAREAWTTVAGDAESRIPDPAARTLLTRLHPLSVEDGVLHLTTTVAGPHKWLEQRIGALLDASADRCGLEGIRWIDHQTATTRTLATA